MINYYQPFLLPFLTTKPYKLPKGIRRHYYFSWEDGLWDLLQQKNIPKGSAILIPDFYCMDVVENIKNHGYRPVFYPLNKQLQIPTDSFIQILKKEKPLLIIIFHACGITSNLIKDHTWTRQMKKETIILEDCVHRLLDPSDIDLIHPNHIVMDSLRKDSPLPGSFIYGSNRFLTYQPNTHIFTIYFWLSAFYFLLFKLTLTTSFILNNPQLTKYAHEVVLKNHDDIIGDSLYSHAGIPGIPLLHRFIDFKKVKQTKQRQVQLYKDLLKERNPLYQFTIDRKDFQHLHVFPLGVTSPVSRQFIDYLHQKGIVIWNKFPDCPWSQRHSVLFLPLGFHITDLEIKTTLNVIVSYGL